jgi:hypothetical protein
MRPLPLAQKKKLRKKDTTEDLSFLEREAAASAATDHGSRDARGALIEAEEAKREEAARLKEERYVNNPKFTPWTPRP